MFGSSMIKEIYDVAVVVSDGKESRDWYKDVLGFEVIDDEDHWITVAPRGSKTVLHLCQAGDKSKLEPGNTGIAFAVDSVDRTYEELSKMGVEFTRKPEDKGWGKNAMFKDPDSNEFWLYE